MNGLFFGLAIVSMGFALVPVYRAADSGLFPLVGAIVSGLGMLGTLGFGAAAIAN